VNKLRNDLLHPLIESQRLFQDGCSERVSHSCTRLCESADNDIIRPELHIIPDSRVHVVIANLTGLVRQFARVSISCCHIPMSRVLTR
jgi:hypothetical protein